MVYDKEVALKRVRANVRNVTEEQILAIAEHHAKTGDSVWHSVHVVLKTPKCHCALCNIKNY